ncbi:SAM-dependent methyltransferase [Actinocrinis sp.]|uniref:SAM-dependent methyltransferase n=1 Tax=Actinocrinis sp. TaxID=1920516 RepID=UPI002D503267|nr:SAM-dependent methyltransferase [Actinocrinis sp.]HZP51278.1 SAM-dependent methyltransferase [Actinocrinis sp.]
MAGGDAPTRGNGLIPAGTPASAIDTSVPHPARMYDYFLGGRDNYEVDRYAAEQVIAVVPEVRDMARENRAFLGRAVRFLAQQGIRQFLDIGTGIPGPGNTGDVARAVNPDARVVYVDNDPIVLVHANALLAGQDPQRTTVIQADLRDPDAILGHPATNSVLDFAEPVAILLVAVLHFIMDDEDPVGIVDRLKQVMVPGSYLVVSHGTSDIDPERAAEAVRTYNRGGARIIARTGEQIRRFFEGLEPVDPGLVQLPLWRPDAEVSHDISGIWWYAGMAGKS